MNIEKNNPLVSSNEITKFDIITLKHFMPAIDQNMKSAKNNLKSIIDSNEKPDFSNTVIALELLSQNLDRIISIYFVLYGVQSDNKYKKLSEKISPMMADFKNDIILNKTLFEKVKYVYDHASELNLDGEDLRLAQETYNKFIKNGSLLNSDQKIELREIDKELSALKPKFTQNLLNATKKYELHIIGHKEVQGIPESVLEIAAAKAKENDKDGWIFTLDAPVYTPVMTYAENPTLREKMHRAFNSRANGGEFSNKNILKRITTLRNKRANLLGLDSHAHYMLQNRMAQTPEKVNDFIENLLTISLPKAKKELDKIKIFARDKDDIDKLKPWDLAYYSVQMKKHIYGFDQEDLRPYFKVEYVVKGVFKVASMLYGLKFQELKDIPVYASDVKVYRTTDGNDRFLGLLYMDLFPRETKRGGAWKTILQHQGLINGEMKRPHVLVAANLTPSTPSLPSLLKLSEVKTIFHEFGHALHSLLSECKYASLSGTQVYRDFVELPSKIMENWITQKDCLLLFARHHKTDEPIPDELIDGIIAAKKYNAGIHMLGQLRLSILDMAWHTTDPSGIKDITIFEDSAVSRTRLFPKINGTNISCKFNHIFSGGYSAGYYSYKWSEVLDADAFKLFKMNGIFDQKTADRFRDCILTKGNTQHPMDLYRAFLGREPDSGALLERQGLA